MHFLSDLIVSVVSALLSFFDGALPTYDLDPSGYATVQTSIQTVMEWVRDANFILPLSDMLLILGIDVGIRIFKFSVFIVNWIIRRVADVIP